VRQCRSAAVCVLAVYGFEAGCGRRQDEFRVTPGYNTGQKSIQITSNSCAHSLGQVVVDMTEELFSVLYHATRNFSAAQEVRTS
jgi:hypothetical protein